jgi:Ca2+-binding EF-hand superfamily protein
MVRLVATMAVLVLLLAGGAFAEDTDTPLMRALAANPDRFEARALDLVAGFGGPEGLTAEGIGHHVALERAAARASAMRRLLALDLDADGSVARAELRIAQAAASAGARGRMERQFVAADRDGDGKVSPEEIAADGNAAALRALGEEEEALLLALLTLDADGDGGFDADELRKAMARLDDKG